MASFKPAGATTITPYLTIKGADKAIEYYTRVFGATELCRMSCPQSGAVMHAELTIGDSQVYLSEACPEMGSFGPGEGPTGVTVHTYLEDVDATFAKAVEEGGTALMPPADMFWGDRFAKIKDPFGHSWSLATHVEDVTPEQMKERMDAFFAASAPA